jgi:hypothetical protein
MQKIDDYFELTGTLRFFTNIMFCSHSPLQHQDIN